MTKREVGYLLIGLGVGLIFSVVAIVYFVLWFQRMFIVGIQWHPVSLVLALPLVFVLVGWVFLSRGEKRRNQN